MSKMKCSCQHLGRCPVYAVNPLVQTYEDGSKVYRALTSKETTQQDPGDFVGTADGVVYTLAKAIDPQRAIARGRAVVGKTCKAQGFLWRTLHPVPGVDRTITPEQVEP